MHMNATIIPDFLLNCTTGLDEAAVLHSLAGQGRGAEAVHSKASIMAGNRGLTNTGAGDKKGH